MKPVTIAVSVKHPGFAEDLARGLMELGNSYVIETAEPEAENSPEKNWEVLVTDFEEKTGLAACFEPYRVIRVADDTCRISEICSRIHEAVRLYRDGGEYPKECDEGEARACAGGRTKLAVFRSLWGGAGVTSLSVAAGRMLSGAYGERVLYVPLTGRDGSLMYRSREECRPAAGCTGELFYRMRNQRPLNFSEYICADYSGMEYLSLKSEEKGLESMTDEERKEFLNLLMEREEYDWILADSGTERAGISGRFCVMVDNLQDSRTSEWPAEGETAEAGQGLRILVQNRGLRNHLAANSLMELMDDGESFVSNEEGYTEIILSKSYGAGIKIFSEWLLEMGSNPADWCR